MKLIENKTIDEERALYGSENLLLRNCRIEGPADGESALKESSAIKVESCFFNLRYPFWHNTKLIIEDTEMGEKCRAPLWYSSEVILNNCKINGVKAIRECNKIMIEECDIVSPEFGWNTDDLEMVHSRCEGEYFMMRASNFRLKDMTLKGKYSFQYVHDATLTDCRLDTKDALWHAKNVIVRDSVINSEYLAWYSDNVTFINCEIRGTQPFCYCKNLKITNCEMHDADLAFEKSQVEASIRNPIKSIKNPYSGYITLPYAEEIILTDENAKCNINQLRK